MLFLFECKWGVSNIFRQIHNADNVLNNKITKVKLFESFHYCDCRINPDSFHLCDFKQKPGFKPDPLSSRVVYNGFTKLPSISYQICQIV